MLQGQPDAHRDSRQPVHNDSNSHSDSSGVRVPSRTRPMPITSFLGEVAMAGRLTPRYAGEGIIYIII